MIKTLLRIKPIIIIVIICIMVGGPSGIAWCQHVEDGAENGHLVVNKTDHEGDNFHSHDRGLNLTHFESSCESHKNDCVDVPFSQQSVTTNNASSINRIISEYHPPLQFWSMDWILFPPGASGQFRPPFKSANHVNQQLAALQTIVLLH